MEKRQLIVYFGRQRELRCDGRCDKAWGINGRPRVLLSERDDDSVYLPDRLLGTAPGPGETVCLSEGGHLKPSNVPFEGDILYPKWCVRECERSAIDEDPPDLEHPTPNMPDSAYGGFLP